MYIDIVLQLPNYGITSCNVQLCVNAKIGDWNFDKEHMQNEDSSANKVKKPQELTLGISEKGILFLDSKYEGSKKIAKIIRGDYSRTKPLQN
eukprot:TRINITY_DN5204_c0_g1_i1.p1 TRINITY_DN5204_c0_g1~~TRINITY_DN5204_c0_g1_i1.p1  ORF type:complete len:92 (+),score=8.39 TRINITY_DN5204_c0_g1_i1:453-728(+)